MPEQAWPQCPGCGVELPGPAVVDAEDRRRNASPACWQVYGELAAYEYEHLAELGRYHQLMVDTYGAQHAGGDRPGIATPFGLIGLDLHLEHGWGSTDVRDAHQDLARRHREWPVFDPPPDRGTLTVVDVALTGSPAARAAAVVRWAQDVWGAWVAAGARPRVESLLDERLPGWRARTAG